MDNGQWFMALVLVLLVSALPSAAFGALMARRAGRPAWHGALPGFFLPWVGLLFVSGQPTGSRSLGGAGRYSMVMLLVAALLVVVSVFLPWVRGGASAGGQGAEFAFTPHEVLPIAVLVWLLAAALVAGAVGLLWQAGLGSALFVSVVVSLLGGLLLASYYLAGPSGPFAVRLAELSGEARVGPGAWIAIVALVTAYVAVLTLPFGLRLAPVAPPMPPPPPQQWQPGPAVPPAPQQWGGGNGRPGATW